MEMYAEVKARFASDALALQGIEFLDEEGPEEREEVEEGLRAMFDALQESMPAPPSADALGDGWLRVSFDILGEYASDGGHEFVELWLEAGVECGYVLLTEDYEELWLIQNEKIEQILDSDALPEWYQGDQWRRDR